MKDNKGMSIKKENDALHEKHNASPAQEESKAISYFRNFMSTSQTNQKKERLDKNEPGRFLGDGVSFKAKLIGILEVNEPRGDRMCQEALADLKMAIRAAGEHKQRININIALDGLRLRDEKTGDSLYHHPVHKISFIAQDASDNRAFGYIFGSPDTGHRFFGIKTDKAANQVVITMRDLFQVVFEFKKKEIEIAKQQHQLNQIKYSSSLFPDSANKVSLLFVLCYFIYIFLSCGEKVPFCCHMFRGINIHYFVNHSLTFPWHIASADSSQFMLRIIIF